MSDLALMVKINGKIYGNIVTLVSIMSDFNL